MEKESPVANPPASFREKVKWLGPGFLWMVSAAGSGELLFTPRVGALYGYQLLWAMMTAVALKWFINREIGRYTVCTGKNIIDGFSDLPGPKNLSVYLILVPQLFVAVSSIAGLAGSAATALVVALPGNIKIWTIASILVSTALVLFGKFSAVEKVATTLAVALGVAAVVAATLVFPEMGKLGQGLIPKVPEKVNYGEVLPWLGFMLSGAAGLIWYSYWIQKKGYGWKKKATSSKKLSKAEISKLKGWLRQMTTDSSVAVIGTLIVTLSFLILGAQLLQPKGLVPEENKVAETLGNMLGELWGPVGFWFMITAVFVGFWDTVLSDQDGFGRMFTGGTRALLKQYPGRFKWATEKVLKRIFVVGLVTVLPIVLYLLMGEPVGLLKIAGAIEACHIPTLVVLVLYLNYKDLPEELKPSIFTVTMTALAGLFFAVFAVIYIMQISSSAGAG
jgi:Mn2+/Fe2+ NRAMP family transporter